MITREKTDYTTWLVHKFCCQKHVFFQSLKFLRSEPTWAHCAKFFQMFDLMETPHWAAVLFLFHWWFDLIFLGYPMKRKNLSNLVKEWVKKWKHWPSLKFHGNLYWLVDPYGALLLVIWLATGATISSTHCYQRICLQFFSKYTLPKNDTPRYYRDCYKTSYL